MNQPCTEQTIRDNEQLAELDVMYKETERALVLIGDRMREIKNRLQKKPPVIETVTINGNTYLMGEIVKSEGSMIDASFALPVGASFYTKLAGGKYEK